MKTVIDSVNELKADFMSAENGGIDGDFLMEVMTNEYCDNVPVGGFVRYTMNEEMRGRHDVRFVCTFDEFNSCVDELSAANWIDGVSIKEWKARMKNTVIDSQGNELEIGKVYEFSNDKIDWYVAEFKNVSDCGSEYLTKRFGCKLFIRECQLPLGTIKEAPVKLVDGKAYQFESVVTGRIWVGFYNSAKDRFDESVGGDGRHCYVGDVSDFKNFIPLAPETK